MTLKQIKKGCFAKIVNHQNDETINLFLSQFGLLAGDSVKVIRPSILGSPITLELQNGSRLAMRTNQAENILVEIIEG